MADAETWRLSKNSPSDLGTAEPIALSVLDDLARGKAALRAERVSIYGRHAQYLLCTPDAGVDVAGRYPSDGTTPIAMAGGVDSITLDPDAPDFPLNGLLVLLVAGPGAGQARYVADYDTLTKEVAVVPDWEVAPDGTTEYRILVPCLWSSKLLAKAEFEESMDLAPTAVVAAVFYDFPFIPPTSGVYAGQSGVATGAGSRRPETHVGVDWDLDNLDDATDASTPGYRVSRVRAEVSDGMIGAKLWLRTPPNAGRIRLCACAV